MQNKFQVYFNYYSSVNEFPVKPFQTNRLFLPQRGRGFPTCAASRERLSVCTTRRPSFSLPLTHVLPIPVQTCRRAPVLLPASTRPLFPTNQGFLPLLEKNCQGLCQMSSYKSIKSTGAFKSKWQKTASVDLTVKTSLTCPASVWFWFWFTVIRLLKGQHHSARDSMG